jgi:hypothetical protein
MGRDGARRGGRAHAPGQACRAPRVGAGAPRLARAGASESGPPRAGRASRGTPRVGARQAVAPSRAIALAGSDRAMPRADHAEAGMSRLRQGSAPGRLHRERGRPRAHRAWAGAGAAPSRGTMAASGRGGREGSRAPPSERAGLHEHEEERGTGKKGDKGGLTTGKDDAAGGSEGQGDFGAAEGVREKGRGIGRREREKGGGGWAQGQPSSGGGGKTARAPLLAGEAVAGGGGTELGRQTGPKRGRGRFTELDRGAPAQ